MAAEKELSPREKELKKTRTGRRALSLQGTKKFEAAQKTMGEWKTKIEKYLIKQYPDHEDYKAYKEVPKNDVLRKYNLVFKVMSDHMKAMDKSLRVMTEYYSLLASHEAEVENMKRAAAYNIPVDAMETEQLRAENKAKSAMIRRLQAEIERLTGASEEPEESEEVRAD